jgi:cytochrome c peroxidase
VTNFGRSKRWAAGVAALLAVAAAAGIALTRHLSPPALLVRTIHRDVRAALGRQIFFDQTLSDPPGTSCASCHDPAHAFSGNNGSTNGVARGSRPGHFARRNTPSVLYLKFVKRFHYHWEEDAPLPDAFGGFFWDGRADSLAALVEQPLTNPDEMNARDAAIVATKIAAAPYAGDLRKEYGALSPAALRTALDQAIEAFLTSDEMAPFSSRYDDYLAGRSTLSPIEMRGLALFRDPEKGNCGSCHRVNLSSPDPSRSMFTDYGYEALAVPRNDQIPANRNPAYADLGLCERNDARSHTNDPRLCGSFKTPSLRNVAARAYLMHNGEFTSLRDAVAFYATRSTDPQRWYGASAKFDDIPARYRRYVNERVAPYDRREGENPRLDDRDIDALVAFLEALTDAPYREVAERVQRKSESAFRVSESRSASPDPPSRR